MQMMHAVVQAAKVQGVVFIDIYIYILLGCIFMKTMESAKQRPLKGKNIHNFTFRISRMFHILQKQCLWSCSNPT